MQIFVVMRFDPMQCGACGNGNLDKVFLTLREAEAYVKDAGGRRGVSWEIAEKRIESYQFEEALAA